MIEINEKTFEYALSEFKNIVEKDTNKNLVEFKTNSFIDEHENYKYAVLEQAKNSLLNKTWKENEIGNGKILKLCKWIMSKIMAKFAKFSATNTIWVFAIVKFVKFC